MYNILKFLKVMFPKFQIELYLENGERYVFSVSNGNKNILINISKRKFWKRNYKKIRNEIVQNILEEFY